MLDSFLIIGHLPLTSLALTLDYKHITTSRIFEALLHLCPSILRLARSFANRAFVVALKNLSMLVNLVLFTKCGGLSTSAGAVEIAHHTSN